MFMLPVVLFRLLLLWRLQFLFSGVFKMYIDPNEYFDEHPEELDEFESELERLEEEREFALIEQGMFDVEEWLAS